VVSTEPHIDPESLVARIIAELQANPDAQRLLLRALLTNEFLGIPARLDRIEKDIAELKADVAELKADVAVLKTDVAQLKIDVSYLKGSDLENRLHRNLRSIVSQRLDLIRPRIMQSQLLEPINEFADQLYDAYREGRINQEQYVRVERTDFIMRAQISDNHAPVLVAVEASVTIDAHDIQRARDSADALATVFGIETIAVVAGNLIDPRDTVRAEAANVKYLPAD
jgi:regulator of replication initiation timing